MATHDYVIANASGAAVRQDINNALAAIVSNNSSATEPGTTYAFQFWFDTTNNILKIRNAANSAWIDWITTTATVLLPDGAVGTPSLTFASETDTGLYRIAANTLGIATSGTERVEISDTGIIINEGGEAAIDVRIEGDSDANLVFIDAGNDRVGIGTAAPGHNLDISPSTGAGEVKIAGAEGQEASIRLFADQGDDAADIKRLLTDTSGNFKIQHYSGSAFVDSIVIDSSGKAGIGDSSPDARCVVYRATQFSGNPAFSVKTDAGSTKSTKFMVDGDGNVSIGTSTPNSYSGYNTLTINGTTSGEIDIESNGTLTGQIYGATGVFSVDARGASTDLRFRTNTSERMRLDSSGRLLIGTSTSKSSGAGQYAPLNVQGYIGSATGGGELCLSRGEAASSIAADEQLGAITFTDSAGFGFASINCKADAAAGSSDYPGRLEFKTAADGSGSMSERMRLDSSGRLLVGTTSSDMVNNTSGGGCALDDGGINASASGEVVANFNRSSGDGTICTFRSQGNSEGSISISGSTTSFNGGHLSRWSQLAAGAARTEILRGSVLSNLDEMCVWGEEDNEQLNRMKVSDVEGDVNVSGVFQCWDDDDETYVNDFFCAMTGDFVIRIAQGTTVARGDLLMSAGDGTAKPQDDDIIRSKTIAKVTSTVVSTTHADGSYCVPCVLMAC